MAYTDSEVLKIAGNAIAAGVLGSSGKPWYETRLPNGFIVDPESIWTELDDVRSLPASSFTEAIQNAVDNPSLIRMVGYNADGTLNDSTAIRLTPVPGSKNTTFAAYRTYNSPASGLQKNWLQPQLIPQANGLPSAVYGTSVWIGPPSNGNLLASSAGSDANWISHIWNPAMGVLMFSLNDAPPSAIAASDEIYVTGFLYAGEVGGSGGGGSFSGDTLDLDGPNGSWRIRVTGDGAYLKMERKDIKQDGTSEWNSYQNIGASTSTDGLILTRPYAISFDRGNDLDSSNLPDLAQALALSGVDQDLVLGNPDHQTIISTKKGGSVQRSNTLALPRKLLMRDKDDKSVLLDRREVPDPDTVTELKWRTVMNPVDIGTSHGRVVNVSFNVLSIDGPVTTECPCRLAIVDKDGNLIQESLSLEDLDAGVNTSLKLKPGVATYQISPAYEERFFTEAYIVLSPKRGFKLELAGGDYDYENWQGINVKETAPWGEADVEYFDLETMLDTGNFQEEIADEHFVYLHGGVSSRLASEDGSYRENAWQQTSIGEHVDTRNTYVGNFYDKTYVNAGSGGLWSLVESTTVHSYLWSSNDRERISNTIDADQTLVTTELIVPLEGIFNSEFDEREDWEVVNLYKVQPLLEYIDDDPSVTEQGYRVSIVTVDHEIDLYHNMTKFDFLNGTTLEEYKLSVSDGSGPQHIDLSLPKRTFAVNRNSRRYVRFQFQKPVTVYGYYKDPVIPSDPQPEEFVPAVKCDVVHVIEEEILTGTDIEKRINRIEGEREWIEANEENLYSLHLNDSQLALKDFAGEWIIFFRDEGDFTAQDRMQVLYSGGRECVYMPTNAQRDFSYVSPSTAKSLPLVVRLEGINNINSFSIVISAGAGFLSPGQSSTLFPIYIDTQSASNDHMFELGLNIGEEAIIEYSRDRNGQYGRRVRITTAGEARIDTPHDPNLIIPVI